VASDRRAEKGVGQTDFNAEHAKDTEKRREKTLCVYLFSPFVPSVLGGKNYLQPLAFSLQPLLENA
jgi:hypothetical protein